MDPIKHGQHISLEQRRAVRAALEMRGSDLKAFAAEHSLSYGRLLRMLSGDEQPSPKYADRLASLVRIHLVKRVRSNAFAQAA